MAANPKTANYYSGVGRRKAATAQARLSRGKGEVMVNGLPAAEYFAIATLAEKLQQPLMELGRQKDFNISVLVRGGGKSGQADAARLAIAKAVVSFDSELRPTLKKAGYIKRDARIKERKKYGLKRARKAPQFTKR